MFFYLLSLAQVVIQRGLSLFLFLLLSHFVTGLLRRLLWVPKGTVVARFVPASVWKFAYTHNERRQSSLKATQCCGSALPPKTGAQSGTACGGGVLIVQNTAMPWYFRFLLFAVVEMTELVFTKIHKYSSFVCKIADGGRAFW